MIDRGYNGAVLQARREGEKVGEKVSDGGEGANGGRDK